MQRTFLLLFCGLTSLFAAAQTPSVKIEQQGTNRLVTHTYSYYDSDSIRYTINPENDTIILEKWTVNGRLTFKRWAWDSMHRYERSDGYWVKSIKLNREQGRWRTPIIESDSIVHVYENGETKAIFSKQQKRAWNFYETGQLSEESWYAKVSFNDEDLLKKKKYFLEDGKPMEIFEKRIEVKGKDSFLLTFDTLFYPNGQLCKIRHTRQTYGSTEGKAQETPMPNDKAKPSFVTVRADAYDSLGRKTSFYPPDSAAWFPFKDNIACFYGFRTGFGDTVVVPKYDFIQEFGQDFYAAYRGQNCTLYRADGTIVPLPNGVARIGIVPQNDFSFLYFEDFQRLNSAFFDSYDHFVIITNDKKVGLVDRFGKLLIPPMYEVKNVDLDNDEQFEEYDKHSNSSVFDNGNYLLVKENFVDQGELSQREILIDKAGRSVFEQELESIQQISDENYWHVRLTKSNLEGLANREGRLLLPPQYVSIKVFAKDLFLASVSSEFPNRYGVFDAKNQKWLLDTSHFELIGSDLRTHEVGYCAFNDTRKAQSFLLSEKGEKVILPHYFRYVESADGTKGIVIGKTDSTAQFLEIANPNKKHEIYQSISHFTYYNDRSFYCVEKNGKWWFIDGETEQPIIPTAYDYIGAERLKYLDKQTLLVKDNQIYSLVNNSDFFPKVAKGFDYKHYQRHHRSFENFASEPVFQNMYKVFIFDTTGAVVVPPQYQNRSVNYRSNKEWVMLQDDFDRKKVFFYQNRRMIDFPFNYDIEWVAVGSPILVVSETDTVTQSASFTKFLSDARLGVANTEGKMILPCEYYAIAIADTVKGIFFAKRDTPDFAKYYYADFQKLPSKNTDSLTYDDENWYLYDRNGKLLNPQPFRFPIYFQNGIGVGMIGDKMGIYTLEGKLFSPPQYDNLWRDAFTGLFVSFDRIGLMPNVVLMDRKGQNRLKNSRFDGISVFFGKYALVTQQGRVGLIDSLGKVVIPPQELKTYTGSLIDSLQAEAKRNSFAMTKAYKVSYSEMPSPLPVSIRKEGVYYSDFFAKYDTIKMNRNRVIRFQNILLDLNLDLVNNAINRQRIDRKYTVVHRLRSWNSHNGIYFRDVYAGTQEDNFWGFIQEGNFMNYQLKNGRLEKVVANEFWKKDFDSRRRFQDVLTDKIRKLPDAHIDCSDGNSLVERAQTQFFLQEKGVKILLNKSSDGEYEELFFSWEEIKPFVLPAFQR